MKECIYIIFFTLLVFSFKSESKQTQKTKIGYIQENFTGTDKQSFSNGSPAYGAELSIEKGGKYIGYFLKTKVSNSIGSQNFIKSGITYFSKYEFTAIETDLGLTVFPLGKNNDERINVYIWGAAGISYNNLSISSVPATVNVKAKSQEFGTGYSVGLGVELALFKREGGILAYSEVGLREYRAPIAGLSAFEISGMTFSFGIGF